jgi:hypothetical protein
VAAHYAKGADNSKQLDVLPLVHITLPASRFHRSDIIVFFTNLGDVFCKYLLFLNSIHSSGTIVKSWKRNEAPNPDRSFDNG